jgi:hypothetical protein
MATRTESSDGAPLEQLVTELAGAMADVVSRGWAVSPPATVLALARLTAVMASRHVSEHPECRQAALAMLRSVVELVEVETAPPTRTH